MAAVNCWEFMACGREPDGVHAAEMGVCPASTATEADGLNHGTNGGRICWAVTGTFCRGKVQGTFAQKQASCLACRFFVHVRKEEADFICLPASFRGRGVEHVGIEPILRKDWDMPNLLGEMRRRQAGVVPDPRPAPVAASARRGGGRLGKEPA